MRTMILAVLLLVLHFSTNAQKDTFYIKTLRHFKEGKINVLLTPGGKRIEVRQVPMEKETKAEEKPGIPPEVPTTAISRSYVDPNLTPEQKAKIRSNECKNEKFAGLSRAGVKTKATTGVSFVYPSLTAFLNTLPKDEDMGAVIEALNEPWRERSIQEMKNATLLNIFLLAYAREDDNDYHLIITNSARTVFFNAELSALPAATVSGYQTLKAVRQNFETFPGATSCGKYTILQTPLRIKKLKGSIFFDTDHPAGTIGPGNAKPKTAWEIHPITALSFE